MEKLICSACGAPLTPNTNEPFLTCEYCDTTVANKYYVEPEVEEVQETAAETAETVTEAIEETEENASSSGGLLKTLLGVGTAIAAGSLRKRSRPTVVRHTPVVRSAPRTAPVSRHRHPEPPRAGGMGARPARPTQSRMARPQGGRGMGGPGGRGGRGGMGGPGGRHR